jgi:uncharacterized protein (DUF3084 family)
MSEEGFAQLEEEFVTMSAALGRRLVDIQRGAGGDLKDAFQEAEQDAYDAANTLKKLEQEVRSLSYHAKSKAQTKLDGLQATFKAQRAKLDALKASGGTDDGSEGSTGGGAGAGDGMSRADRQKQKDQRKKLLGARATSDESSESLARTQQALRQAEENGTDTAATLLKQREQLIAARDTIRETDDFLLRSQKTLRRIRRRLVTNKLITGFIILLQLATVALIVWLKWYN